jgi:guanosine-3',5'-bis(diphosphate) 3'-pyrophosphohydrolase
VTTVLKHEGGIADIVVLCAGMLHNTIEDTETTTEDKEMEFG